MEFLRTMLNKLIILTGIAGFCLMLSFIVMFIVKGFFAVFYYITDEDISLVDKILGTIFLITMLMILITVATMVVELLMNAIIILLSNRLFL